jgi:hypothetical protein
MFKKLATLFGTALLSILSVSVFAQLGIPFGKWRVHLPYNQVQAIEIVGNKVYAATPGGFFYLDLELNSIRQLSKIDGFNDVGINQLHYNAQTQTLLIGYRSANLDLLRNNRIFNLNAIARRQVIGSKTINAVAMDAQFAYLATNIGLIVVNMERIEIRENTQDLGALKSIAILGDSIYVGTAQGIRVANKNRNLLNMSNWTLLPTGTNGLPANVREPQTLCVYDGKIYAGYHLAGAYRRNSYNQWVRETAIPAPGQFYSINNNFGTKLTLTMDNAAFIANKDAEGNLQILGSFIGDKLTKANLAKLDSKGFIYIGDDASGLLSNREGELRQYTVNGPFSSRVFRMHSFDDKIVVTSGGVDAAAAYAQLFLKDGAFIFKDNRWENFNTASRFRFPFMVDYIGACYNPRTGDMAFATYGHGILLLRPDGSTKVFSDTNTNTFPPPPGGFTGLMQNSDIFPLGVYDPSDPNRRYDNYVRTTGCAFDQQENLYVLQFTVDKPFAMRSMSSKDSTWTKYPFSDVSLDRNRVVNSDAPFEVLIDKFNYKWVRMAPRRSTEASSIWIFTPDNKRRTFVTAARSKLPDADIYKMAFDANDHLWVATGKGVAVSYNPYFAFPANNEEFTESRIEFSTPIFPPEAGRPVLENHTCTSIAIDGANRKWVSTSDAGVWLFNADMTELIHHFTAENSPLLSNNVIDLAINNKTGEVFFGTDLGIISYQSDAAGNVNATDVNCRSKDVNVFPNPVRPDYDGVIGISGIAPNSTVKITDVSGKLFYETVSNGTTTTWNGSDYRGKKAKPGVYLVFSATEEGKFGCVAKVAIIH